MDILSLFLSVCFIAFGWKLFRIFLARVKQRVENNDNHTADTGQRLWHWLDSIEIAIFAAIVTLIGTAMLISFVNKRIL